MSERLVIRRERPDQPEVVALLAALDVYLKALYPPEANHILDVQALLGDDVAFYVARDGERAVGTAAFRQVPGEPDTGGQRYGEVKRMYVDPAQRGQRVGVRLLQALEAGMQAAGCRLALLETGCHQHEAVAMYERCGYTQRPAFGGYPDNGLSLFYGKPL
ncbi:MAG: GNAT family N-acetyltransferase [Rubrivivax sp.]|nr:GNAT family N-acetyltransferase [Rubrivivax sp.]